MSLGRSIRCATSLAPARIPPAGMTVPPTSGRSPCSRSGKAGTTATTPTLPVRGTVSAPARWTSPPRSSASSSASAGSPPSTGPALPASPPGTARPAAAAARPPANDTPNPPGPSLPVPLRSPLPTRSGESRHRTACRQPAGTAHKVTVQVTAAVLLYRAVTYLPSIPLGAVACLIWRHAPALIGVSRLTPSRAAQGAVAAPDRPRQTSPPGRAVAHDGPSQVPASAGG